jgi:Flp pilus assembly protein TadD
MRFGAMLFCCLGAAATVPAAAAAQSYVGRASEQPADALARNLKILATSPQDFNALIGAGKAALALGDGQAAAGFFGRAEEVWPNNSQPQIGMGAALTQEGDAALALQYFTRAVQLGAVQSMVGLERGLAYDLLGNHQQAQADYRASLVGPDADEARRRLALSLAIGGNKAEALTVLSPLMARGDAGSARSRAFVLALTGDAARARAAIEAAMPGSSFQMDYFFRRLPGLASAQKAAAVHLGIFPDGNSQVATAPVPGGGYPAPPPAAGTTGSSLPVSRDGLASIDQLLSQGAPSATSAPLQRQPAPRRPTRVASVPQPNRAPAASRTSAAGANQSERSDKRHWVQLASGSNVDALPAEFRRIKSRYREVFEGINGYVAEEGERARLLVGPFKDAGDARTFANGLETINVRAFSWTKPPEQAVRKLPAE